MTLNRVLSRMNFVTSNEFTVKDTFCFAEEIVEQDISLLMGSLDVDSLFINILLDETSDICTSTIYSEQVIIEGINKEEFRNLLSLATKESCFIFNEVLYQQNNGFSMGSPLCPTLGNAFLLFFERKWIEECLSEFKPVFYRKYVDDIFVLFKSIDHPEILRNYFNTCPLNMSFSFEKEKKW